MYAVPEVDEVVAVAKELGIHLGQEEAALYRKHLMEQLSQLDAFVQARVEEPRPPMVSAGREPGWRPSPEEAAIGGFDAPAAGAAARGSEPADELRA
jgi:hypothetical protein